MCELPCVSLCNCDKAASISMYAVMMSCIVPIPFLPVLLVVSSAGCSQSTHRESGNLVEGSRAAVCHLTVKTQSIYHLIMYTE